MKQGVNKMKFMAVSVDKENLIGWKNKFYEAATDCILHQKCLS